MRIIISLFNPWAGKPVVDLYTYQKVCSVTGAAVRSRMLDSCVLAVSVCATMLCFCIAQQVSYKIFNSLYTFALTNQDQLFTFV